MPQANHLGQAATYLKVAGIRCHNRLTVDGVIGIISATRSIRRENAHLHDSLAGQTTAISRS